MKTLDEMQAARDRLDRELPAERGGELSADDLRAIEERLDLGTTSGDIAWCNYSDKFAEPDMRALIEALKRERTAAPR